MRCLECDIQFFSPALPGDNEFYEAFYGHGTSYESEKLEFSYALGKILDIRPHSILDVGCGKGRFLKKVSAAFDIKGLEKNPLSLRHLDFDILDYLEPHRVEHYLGILSGRREKITTNVFESGYIERLISTCIRKAGYLLDLFLTPYVIDHIKFPGLNHGILLRKKDDAGK